MSKREEVLEEFAEAAQLGRRNGERFIGFTFPRRPLPVDPSEEWRRSVHRVIGALVAPNKLTKKWRSKL